jgi:hypothetical protein
VEHHEIAIATMVTATVAAGMRAKDESAEEDDRDGEDDACHDADPGGHGGEPRSARFTFDFDMGGLWWHGGCHGCRNRFRC